MPMTWQQFVVAECGGLPRAYVAAIVQQPLAALARYSGPRPPGAASHVQRFVELFARWRGRAPAAGDWPAPGRSGAGYHWLPPEDELLISLVGTTDKPSIAQALTTRLQAVTADGSARRTELDVQQRMNRLGLASTDIVGGIRVPEAGAEIGSIEIVRDAIERGSLKHFRLGRNIVIAHAEWARWKATRTIAPSGYIRLATLREALGIRSDSKLPEFAAAGYIPTAVRANPSKPGEHSGKNGTWYIDPAVARQLVADRHAGRPMPWHGKPLRDNLNATWKLWQQRKHPGDCSTCRSIWGAAGAPASFDDYARRYPPLAHGAKRHLTMRLHPGLLIAEVAQRAGCSLGTVTAAIKAGALRATRTGRNVRITRTDAARWIARRLPSGQGRASWISAETALQWYGFKADSLDGFVAVGRLKTRGAGASRLYMRQQIAELRDTIGYTETQAATKLRISVAQLRTLLAGVHWRQEGLIPKDTLAAVRKRLDSSSGLTVTQAAMELCETERWVRDRIKDGIVRVTTTPWNARRLYLTEPMMDRLRAAQRRSAPPAALSETWITLAAAARLAGVSTATVNNWRLSGDLRVRHEPAGHRFARVSVMARARRYWPTCRFHRATPPEWLQAELAAKAVP
jgi:excisionase family DNA binding protein